MYKEKLIGFIEKVLMDELSASIYYAKASNELTGLGSQEVAEELKSHSEEEYEHFNQIMEFASNHGLLTSVNIHLDMSVVNYPELSNANAVMRKVQELEKSAIRDYKCMSMRAMLHKDIETAMFFREIMKDEIEHFNDLSFVNGDKLEVNNME